MRVRNGQRPPGGLYGARAEPDAEHPAVMPSATPGQAGGAALGGYRALHPRAAPFA